jgi:putative NIF3 family GTP cyclohydrolase 1 type 2
VRALLAAHPYEMPAYDVYELASLPTDRGLGRIGVLADAMSLRDFTAQVAGGLPATAGGVRVSGDSDRVVRRVAVCGGAGDSLLSEVRRADVDAYVTADLRHHPASEHDEADGPALIDAAHWATEWPWLERAAADLATAVRERAGVTVETTVSTLVTDPWHLHVNKESTARS